MKTATKAKKATSRAAPISTREAQLKKAIIAIISVRRGSPKEDAALDDAMDLLRRLYGNDW